jgi:hypothetical protein
MITGYRLEFLAHPPKLLSVLPVHQSPDNLRVHIQEFLTLGAVIPARLPGFFCPLFVVHQPGRSTEDRLIFNLKPLNRFLNVRPFHMDSIASVFAIIRPADYAITIDLSKAYLHVPIHPDDQKYLMFAFDNQAYQFTALPFGMATAPRVFTMVLRPIIEYFKKKGFRIVIYLDDILILNQSAASARSQALELIHQLQLCGFTINFKKSILQPNQLFKYLGIIWSTDPMKVTLPSKSFEKLIEYHHRLCHRQSSTVRSIQQFLGSANFIYYIHLNNRLFLRPVQSLLRPMNIFGKSPDYIVQIGHELQLALHRWLTRAVVQSPLVVCLPRTCLTTDASTESWGAHLDAHSASGRWSTAELPLHINVKELLAVRNAIRLWGQAHLHQRSILLQIDSVSALNWIKACGVIVNPLAHSIVEEIYDHLLELGSTILPVYIPTSINTIADSLSRNQQQTWFLDPIVFNQMVRPFNPQIDLFASRLHHQCPVYASLDPTDSEAAFVNAFSRSWNWDPAYAFPPPPIINGLFCHLSRSSGTLILITPNWTQSLWFPEAVQRSLRLHQSLPSQALRVYHHQSGQTSNPAKKCQLLCWLLYAGPLRS